MPTFLAEKIIQTKQKDKGQSMFKRCLYFSLVVFHFSLFFTSCLSHKELINFRTGEEIAPTLGTLPKQNITNQVDMTLQMGDVLAIIVMSPDGGILATPFNLGSSQTVSQSLTATSPMTYLVNQEGFIDLPTIGRMKVSGLTTKEVREEIITRVSKDIVNPSVNVRLINFKITVLGEVTQPGILQVPNERMTIVEAIAAAGDFTPYSNRRHVTIVREKNGVREFGEIDFKDTKLFTSPYYFLQQNDVIHIEPMKGKIAQVQQPINTYLQPVSVGLTIIGLLIALFK